MHNSNCDSDSDCEYTDEQNTTFLNNFVVEYQNLIKKYLMNHDILNADKAKIELLDEEMTNFLLKKIDFLSLNIIFFLKRNNVIT